MARDFTSWANCAAIRASGSKVNNIENNYIYVTGGSAIYSGVNAGGGMDVDTISNNIIVGAGLSAIAGGIRAFSTTQREIARIQYTGNRVVGFCCGSMADLHHGITVLLGDNNNSSIRRVLLDNVVDYLAPWETFNTTDFDVDGSHNTNKQIGGVVGSQAAQAVARLGASGQILRAEIYGTLQNHQAQGIIANTITDLLIKADIHNCGWGKDSFNNAIGTQQSIDVNNVVKTTCIAVIEKQSQGVNQNNSFCTPLRITNCAEVDLDLIAIDSGNQNRTIRYLAADAGNILRVHRCDSDAVFVDGGFNRLVDDSAGTNTTNAIVQWADNNIVSLAVGSRSLPLGVNRVVKSYATTAPITVTLLPAAYYKNKTICFYCNAGGDITITPDGMEEIDGVNSSVTVSAGAQLKLYSDGSEWYTAGV